ncbi:MAG TPA: Ig-like domain repeat protein, partial [Gemmatimonadales bacterium]|nr:Ig-like domain repeat protein [Gemmatimonadales bacterium]
DPGAEVTVSFSVSSSEGAPTGEVVVSDANGGGCSGSAPTGSCSYTPNGTGTRTITATYSGSSSFNGSSGTAEHTVTPPPAGTSTSILGITPEPSDPGSEITVSFTVSSSGGTPTGSVEVADANGGGCSGSAPSGSCSYTPNGSGNRTITATYGGNSSFAGSSDTEAHVVTEPPANSAPVATIGSISCTGMNCTFTDASTDPNGNDTIAEWNWIFGDGESSTERNPSHVYAAPAEYQVRLTVTDDGALRGEAGPQIVTVVGMDGG